ncbi:MAG: acylphosphatase [Chitinophagaceae bacterium]|nr:acylphosphatase [Chitinophagaceae bacterium]
MTNDSRLLTSLSLHITGKVQGVYYRQSTRKKALSLGLSGYVQNLPDGSVSILATGNSEQLDELIAWCKIGPTAAIVREVIVKETDLENFEGFEIRRE